MGLAAATQNQSMGRCVFSSIRGLNNAALVQYCKIFTSPEKSKGRIVESRIDVPNLKFSLLLVLGTCSPREVVWGGGWKEQSVLSLCFPCIVPYESISLQPLPSVQTAPACEERMADLCFLSSRWGSFLLPL